MKLVLNALQYKKNSSGIGLMVSNLFQEMIRLNQTFDIEVLLSNDSPPLELEDAERVTITRLHFKKSQVVFRNLYEMFFLGRRHLKDSIFITVDSKAPLFLPKSCRVIPIITDLAVFRMGEVYQWERRMYWRFLYKNLVRRVKRYFTISEFTKQEMADILKIPKKRSRVIHCAGNRAIQPVTDPERILEIRKKYRLPEKYLLFVGNFNPRKNLERILLAFDQLKTETGMEEKLVIVGETGWKFDAGKALLQMAHREDVLFTGYVPNEELSCIYSCARLFVFCTLYEGFGIPIIEAQKCGVPVLLSDHSCFREVGGDGGYYVDCYDVEAIRQGMERVLCDAGLREKLLACGYKNKERFSWEASAKSVLWALERLGQ